MSRHFESGGQSIGASVSAGLISFRTDWFDLLAVQGISRVFSNTKVQKHIQCKYFLAFPHGTTMAWTSPSTWRTTPPSGSLDCKIAPSQHALHTTGPCSEPINAGLPAFSKQKYRMPSYVQTTQLTMVYPQFKFNWPSCILSGNFYQWLSAALGSKTSLPASICKPHTTGISLTLCSCLLHSLSPEHIYLTASGWLHLSFPPLMTFFSQTFAWF